ncbi:MAG: 3-oxoacyl-[acyl-carrier-protein] synthase III C-terminal domain-containing protein, partial [Actinomycetes bacterium]
VGLLEDAAHAVLSKAGVKESEIDWLIPHQANIRIISSACDKLGIPPERTVTVLHETGNTSSASIPLALFDAADKGRLKDGDLVLLVGFGAGMTAASCVLRWGK